MKEITIPATELFNPVTSEFYYTKETTIIIEHSLVSLSKWESKWKKPFLNKEHSQDQFDDYIRCMTITKNVDPLVYQAITTEIRDDIRQYMDDPMTAAVIHEDSHNKQSSSKFVTSDLIYYWMTALNIPMECQKWHLNRLLTLIRIANIEQKPPKKTSRADAIRHHQSINAARRAAHKKR